MLDQAMFAQAENIGQGVAVVGEFPDLSILHAAIECGWDYVAEQITGLAQGDGQVEG